MFAKLVTQISSFMIQSQILYFLVTMIFYFILKVLNIFKRFILLPYLSKYKHIHSNLRLKYIWSWKNHHTWPHSMDYIHQHVQYPISQSPVLVWPTNGVSIISRKFSQAPIDSKSKDSKIPSTWSFFMFYFQYDLKRWCHSEVIF